MKRRAPRTSGFDSEHLHKMKHASAESKFNALAAMVEFTKEAQKDCKRRGVPYIPAFPD